MNSEKGNQKATQRLLNDLKIFKKDLDNETLFASPQDNNLMKWDCIVFGPDNSPWEGGVFKLELTFTDEYPNKPPTVMMKTKVFHPNFYVDGRICLDILQNNWSPIYDVHSVLESIQSLLTDPNPSSPANVEAAQLYNGNIQEYYKRVKQCVENSQKDD